MNSCAYGFPQKPCDSDTHIDLKVCEMQDSHTQKNWFTAQLVSMLKPFILHVGEPSMQTAILSLLHQMCVFDAHLSVSSGFIGPFWHRSMEVTSNTPSHPSIGHL